MKVTAHGDGVRVRLNMAESHVLEQLLTELQDVLAPGALDRTDPVRERLYPAGYADEQDARAFRELTEAALQAERSERVDQCIAEVRGGRTLRRTELLLDGDAADRWMRVLNDLRLTYGTQLGIEDDDDYALRPGDPQAPLRARYLFLTALQDILVTTLLD